MEINVSSLTSMELWQITSAQSLCAVMIFAFVEALNRSCKAFLWNRFVALGVLKTFCLECLEFAVFHIFNSIIKYITCLAGISLLAMLSRNYFELV